MNVNARRFRPRLSYANITATLALFIALGGTGYAALQLPRNSVGSAQLRKGAVGSSELRRAAVTSRVVKDKAIALRDISASARLSLRGAKGATGPAGPASPALRAVVDPAGQLTGGNAQGISHDPTSNEYRVRFDRDLNGCAFAATLATVPNGTAPPPAGRATLATDGTSAIVRTFDQAGNPVSVGFHLIGGC